MKLSGLPSHGKFDVGPVVSLIPTPLKKALLIIAAFVTCLSALFLILDKIALGTKERVPNDSSGLYFRDSRHVYIYIPRDCGFMGCWGPDLRLQWQKYEELKPADAVTFRIVIDPKYGENENTGYVLAHDASHVFYGGRYVPTGDLRSLQVFDRYGKDNHNLYFRGMVITGIDMASVKILGMDFIVDRTGLYVGNSVPPRRAALIDASTFQIHRISTAAQSRPYFAEDKNFYFYNGAGGGYFADRKPENSDFKKLGCGYSLFRGRVFYSIYDLGDADAATFRVLGGPVHESDSCVNYYAVDSRHRYAFEYQVLSDDSYRNHEIDVLLASPAAKGGGGGENAK